MIDTLDALYTSLCTGPMQRIDLGLMCSTDWSLEGIVIEVIKIWAMTLSWWFLKNGQKAIVFRVTTQSAVS